MTEEHREFMARMEVLSVHIESLHNSTSELHDSISELHDVVRAHSKQLDQDGEHIRALVRIAEIHEHR